MKKRALTLLMLATITLAAFSNENVATTQKEVDESLLQLNGTSSISIVHHQTGSRSTLKQKKIEKSIKITKINNNGTFQLDYTFTPKKTIRNSSIEISFNFENWNSENYVFVPAFVYNGNRFPKKKVNYPPLLTEKKDFSITPPEYVTDIFSLDDKEAKIEYLAGNASTPMGGFFNKEKKRGFLFLTTEGNSYGDYSFIIKENREKKSCYFSIIAPKNRESRYIMAKKVKSRDGKNRTAFHSKKPIMVTIRIYSFNAENLKAFYKKFFEVRKDLTEDKKIPTLPYSEAFKLIENKNNRINWNEAGKYYKVGTTDHLYAHWQLGWVGGGILTYPLLMNGTEESKERSLININEILINSPAPSGLLNGIGKNGVYYSDGFADPHPENLVMTRKNGDGLYLYLKQLDLLKLEGKEDLIDKRWEKTLLNLATYFVDCWKTNGTFGQFADAETGEMKVGGSSSAAIVPAALALASKYFNRPLFLDVAKEATAYYYKNFTQKGYTNGGPGEIFQAPDSESSYALFETYAVLYEVTGEKKFLDMAEFGAMEFASWVSSYSYNFPKSCDLGRFGVNSVGSVFANCQNNHGAPATCTASGDALLKLYRATEDEKYIELLQDTAFNMPQYVATKERLFKKAEIGYISERVNTSDWEGSGNIGQTFGMSTWAEISMLLTAIEIPGLYLREDQKKLYIFDNVEASLIEKDGELSIEIKNPSNYDAIISLMVDDKKSISKPLNWHGWKKWKKIEIKAGETLIYTP